MCPFEQIQNGATFVIVDKTSNPRDGSPALLIQGIHLFIYIYIYIFIFNLINNRKRVFKYYFGVFLIVNFLIKRNFIQLVFFMTYLPQLDDGGGMGPEAMRCCMSFGFSDKKSKSAIGQCKDVMFFILHFFSPSI